jgi:CHAT domain-containing protein
VKPEVTVEMSWTCRTCGTVRPVPAYLVVGLRPEDTWSALDGLLLGTCGSCGQRDAAARATVLVKEDGAEDSPGYMLLPVRGALSAADIEQGRHFLAENRMPPALVAGLAPTGWPAPDTDLNSSVLSVLEADPAIASQVARHERRSRVMTALLTLGSVTSPGQIRETIRACPEFATDGIAAERDLLSILQWPPEADRLAQARAALISVLTSSVTDSELETAYQAFDRGREAGMRQILEAGYDKVRWLAKHSSAPAAEWDPVAVQALHLLGLGGDQRGRAGLLFSVGTYVARRADATQDQVTWAVQCLRESRGLWHDLGDGGQEAVAASHLAMALYAWDYGDAYASACEAEAIMREVVSHYEGTAETGLLAMAMTNLAIILLKVAATDQHQDRIQEAVDLCRKALPLRSKSEDPLGWAFSAANLALALTRLGADDAATRRSHLEQAAAVSREAADILDAQGDVLNADQARINRLDALLSLADQLREERLRAAVGGDETDQVSPAMTADLLDTNPGAFGLAETPPMVAEIVRGPASPDEAQILQSVLGEAVALLAEPRVTRNPGIRSRIARLTVIAWPKLLGPTQEAADAVAVARRLIDETVAPDAAMQTDSLLGSLFTQLDRWAEAAAAFDDDLALNEKMLQDNIDRERVVQTLARAPTLARWTAYAYVRAGDPQTAVTILERTRSRSLSRFVPGAGPGLELLSWRSATLDDIGLAARPACPIAYVLTANAGSAVLLVRRGDDGRVAVTAYESSLSSAFFVAQMWSLPQPERGFLTAQLISADMGPAIRSLMEPLGSLLEPVVADLLADGVRDLILIPAGPAAILPWAAAMVRGPGDSQPTPVGELLTLSVAPSAAAVVLGRQRMAGRLRDAATGRLLVVADPERRDTFPLPGARDEARRIEAAFPARVDVLAGPAAQADAFLDRLPACWVAHLACHGTSNVLQPEETRLLLSDGDVTLGQLLRLPELRARLVVLSACQSGQVDIIRASDEMLGMPLAFLQAGACAVVSTLWPIDDRVTAMLVGRFYEELAAEIGVDGPGDVAAALARAQRWLRSLTGEQARRWRQERGVRELPSSRRSISTMPSPPSGTDAPFADPYFWAGLVAYGR